MKLKTSALWLTCAASLAPAGHASGLIDNVNGLALDKQGQLVHFNALLIGDDGKVEKLVQGKYEPPAPPDRKSTRLNSSHVSESRMPSSA